MEGVVSPQAFHQHLRVPPYINYLVHKVVKKGFSSTYGELPTARSSYVIVVRILCCYLGLLASMLSCKFTIVVFPYCSLLLVMFYCTRMKPNFLKLMHKKYVILSIFHNVSSRKQIPNERDVIFPRLRVISARLDSFLHYTAVQNRLRTCENGSKHAKINLRALQFLFH